MKKDQEQRINENASYLVDVLDIKFTKAYKFAQKNFGLSKEELMELYFVENNS
jgi:hypothetical protein